MCVPLLPPPPPHVLELFRLAPEPEQYPPDDSVALDPPESKLDPLCRWCDDSGTMGGATRLAWHTRLLR